MVHYKRNLSETEEKTINHFRSGKVNIATALAVRGLCLEACENGKIIAINDEV